VTKLTGERGEDEVEEDSSQPTRADKVVGDDRGSRWRRQGGAEGGHGGDWRSGTCTRDWVTGRHG
jgi:hypothetical protein